MDIVRGNLDEISRPACSGRSRPGSRISGMSCVEKAKAGGMGVAAAGGSLEILHPEPSLEATAELTLSPTLSDGWRGQRPEVETEQKNRDPRLQQAVRTMRRLDKILARKQAREKEVKAQGRELSRKLWEELRASMLPGIGPSPEEMANTSHYLALTADQQEHAATFTPVFQTQVPSDEDGEGKQSQQRNRASPQQTGRKRKGDRGKKKTDFIRRNVELVKEARDHVILLDDEKERLLELLEDMEGSSDILGLEEDACERIVAGEGYTPEHREHQQLLKIDAELQAVLSPEDFSAMCSSYSSIPSQINQGSVVYANDNQEGVPGERVLRDNLEQREQLGRLKEIDHQLRTLDCLSDGSALLSKEQLKSLLQEYQCSHRSCSADTQGGPLNSDRTSCYSMKDFPPLSKIALSKLLDDARNLGITVPDEKEQSENEIADYYLSKALANSYVPKLNAELENKQEKVTDDSTKDYYMPEGSRRRSLKKSLCLKEPYNDGDKSSVKASISSLTKDTCGDEVRVEDGIEEQQF